MTDPKRAEFTDEEVEAVAKALFATEEPDRNAWRWSKPYPDDPAGPLAWHDYWLDAARAALVPLTAVKAASKERDRLAAAVDRVLALRAPAGSEKLGPDFEAGLAKGMQLARAAIEAEA